MAAKPSRSLTEGEKNLAASVFGSAIALDDVRICHHKWFWFQPHNVVMAPRGNIHFHPESQTYCGDFSCATLAAQGLFIHEMVHVWQHQCGIFLPLKRHPFCRYDYSIKPGWALQKYGLEQQAEIVRHAFVMRQGGVVRGAPPLSQYQGILPFT